MSKYESMKSEAIEKVIEVLENGFSGYYCDLHNECFNTDYYIIGTYQAKKVLEEFGTFNAIEKVQSYEKDAFGEVYTDLSNAEKLLNMLFYIIGEEVISEVDSTTYNERYDCMADDEDNALIVNDFKVVLL